MNDQKNKPNRLESREFECKLIMEVKNHCCLYAKDSPDYSNKIKRENAWLDIALVLGKRADECQKKWNSLRDNFRQSYRTECNTPSGSGAVPKIKWIHYESLKFLIPYIKVPGDDCGNFGESLDDLIEVTFEDGSWMDYGESNIELEPSPGSKRKSTENSTRPKKQKKLTQDDDLSRVLKAIENVSNSPSDTTTPSSATRKPMQLFFDSIALQVENYSFRKQIELQQKILAILASDFAEDH